MRLWPRKRVYLDSLPRTHDIRFAAIFVLAFCLLVGGLYAVGYFVAGDRLPVGTTVAGIDVGGMRRDAARTRLQDSLAKRLGRPITVSAAGESLALDPQRSGLTLDLDATIDDALKGSEWDPRHMLGVLTGGGAVDLVVDVDRRELAASLSRLDARIERPTIDSRVVFGGGRPRIVAGQDGAALDYDGAAVRLTAALVSGDSVASLGVLRIKPDITPTEASDFLRRVAGPAATGPVRIRVGGATLTVPPRQFVPALRAKAHQGRLRLGINPKVLITRTRPTLARLPRRPVSAKITIRDDRPVITPSRSGMTVGADSWAGAVIRATLKVGPARRAQARAMPDRPRLTTAKARMLRVGERVSSATRRLRPPADPAAVRELAARLDGALVRPQAPFSFLSRVGGREPRPASTVASASYEAALEAGMSDFVRSSGRYFDPGARPGLDARVAWPATDLSWRNATPYGVYVRAWVVGGARQPAATLHVEFWSTRYWRISLRSTPRYDRVDASTRRVARLGCRPRAGSDGFEVDVRRVFRREGQRQRVERSHSDYAPLDRIVCLRFGRG